MKIVILDGGSISSTDLSWDCLDEFADVTFYETTSDEDVVKHIGDADGIFTSKKKINESILSQCPELKFVGVLATGYDNINLEDCKARNVSVYYTPAYSTEAVAQHTISLILEIKNRIYENCKLSEEGHWFNKPGYNYYWAPISLLDGMSLGIIGYGNIGKRVASIAKALGMKINIYSRDKESCIKSDIISLHCPATDDNYHMINEDFISQMKDGAVIINTARGKLIDEAALIKALESGKISAAGLDVLENEPPENNPLIGMENCFVTPHVAWSPKETRQKVIDAAYDNLKAFLNNEETIRKLV